MEELGRGLGPPLGLFDASCIPDTLPNFLSYQAPSSLPFFQGLNLQL